VQAQFLEEMGIENDRSLGCLELDGQELVRKQHGTW